MSRTREHLKIVLLQLREDEEERELEKNAFARTMGVDARQFICHDVYLEAPQLSLLDGCNLLVIGGSRLSVFEDVPHMEAMIELVRSAREKKLPILGICFGAQLLAHAFGGQVARDDAQAEYGTFSVTGTDDAMFDMIFADAPDTFPVQCAHQDSITKLPPSAVLLASSNRCKIEAFMIPGADIYALQFHPERSKADYERLLDQSKTDAGGLSKEKFESVKAALRETPDAESLISKFIDRIVLQKRQ